MNIVELTGQELQSFLKFCAANVGECRSMKVAIDDIDKALKVKVGEGMWSPPMGTLQ